MTNFSTIQKQYFKLIQHKHTFTEESLTQLYDAFMVHYIPNYDFVHEMFRSLLIDEIMISRMNKNKNKYKNKNNTKNSHFLYNYTNTQHTRSTVSFGKKVYDSLVPIDLSIQNSLGCDNITVLNKSLFLNLSDYYLDGQCYDIRLNCWQGKLHYILIAYNYLINRHLKTKYDYIKTTNKSSDYVDRPCAFELIHSSKGNTRCMDLPFFVFDSLEEGTPFLKRVARYVQKTTPSFTVFMYNYMVYCRTDTKGNKLYDVMNTNSLQTHLKKETIGHALTICVYRHENTVQVYFLESNKISKNTNEMILLKNYIAPPLITELKRHFTDTSLHWNEPIFMHSFDINFGKDNKYSEQGYCGLVSIFIIDVLHRNLMMHDTMNIRTEKPEIEHVTEYIFTTLYIIHSRLCVTPSLWWTFMCNYTRLVLHDLFCYDSVSLNDCIGERIAVSSDPTQYDYARPYVVISLNDIITDPLLSMNSVFASVALKRFIVFHNFFLFAVGINTTSTSTTGRTRTRTIVQLLDEDQENNNFDYYLIENVFKVVNIPVDSFVLPLIQFIHMSNSNKIVHITNTVNSPVIKSFNIQGNVRNEQQVTDMHFLFFNHLDDLLDLYMADARLVFDKGLNTPYEFHVKIGTVESSKEEGESDDDGGVGESKGTVTTTTTEEEEGTGTVTATEEGTAQPKRRYTPDEDEDEDKERRTRSRREVKETAQQLRQELATRGLMEDNSNPDTQIHFEHLVSRFT